MEKIIAHCERSPAPLGSLRTGIPIELVHIVERMMAKDPSARPQTPKELVEALKPFAILKSTVEPPMAIEATRSDATLQPDDPAVHAPAAPEGFSSRGEALPLEMSPTSRPATFPWLNVPQHQRVRLAIAVATLIVIATTFIAVRILDHSEKSLPVAGDSWIDLIPQVDPAAHAVAGSWQLRGNELSVEPAQSARLVLSPPPGAEYEFEVQFTRHSGTHSIALMFVMGSGQATFELDAWDDQIAGIQLIAGRDMRDNGTQLKIPPLENGRMYTALVQVRGDRVEGYLDGELLATYRGDGSDLNLLELWRMPDRQSLGVGAYLSATTFHRVRVRRVLGDVEALAAP
jgi:hypothetical protein